jgi:hypothetical protein
MFMASLSKSAGTLGFLRLLLLLHLFLGKSVPDKEGISKMKVWNWCLTKFIKV